MTTPTPARSTATKRITLLVVCVTTAMLMLDIAVVNTALPSIAVDLDAGVSSLQWVIDAYTLALATAVLGAGSWADRRGRRVFVVGLVWFTGASLLCALAPTIRVLDLARAVQGIGGAVLFACSLALLADVFDRGRARASALTAYGATIGGAFAVGPLVGGLLTELLDWRAIFFVNVPIGLVTLLLTLRWVSESRDLRPRAADVPGQLLAAVGLAAFVFAVLRGHEIGWSDAQAVIAFVLAVGALVAFVAHEMRTAEPMLPRTCPRPSPCSSSPVRRRNTIVSSLRGSRCRAHWRSSPSGCS
ncbi:MFS transporter [Rhodococcus sp. GA1]|uniref:MFS transporter n=1 Tax=Rhodococcus sp. GA1 TaxID=2942275 RepID=UPI0020CECB16|nr:MFS transporter [Rhodococcus sp. GA1]